LTVRAVAAYRAAMSTEPSPAAATDPAADEVWSAEDLEAAYLRALDALDAVDSEIVATAEEIAPGSLAEEAPTTPVAVPPPTAKDPDEELSLTAPQVIEACLFVGGSALTAAKLASLLKGDYSVQYVEETIERLNQRYQTEGRPYEIRLGEGGYRLVLRDEYERLRHKVYGLGPREVRLSQDVLEVLALVAYHQPVAEETLAELGKPQSGPTLRQLLRRELIAVERRPDQPKDVRYVTTPRFLSLFGLSSLHDLPRPDELLYK
jgi:segregation and condensation protein B